MTAPEFTRPQRIDSIGAGDSRVAVSADADERAALARRFGILAVDSLSAAYVLHREGAGVRATGQLTASVVQPCSVTGEAVPATIDEPFDLRFVPALDPAGDEVELDAADLDVVPFEGGAVDLGEAAAETLALALDPFPRGPNAAAALAAAGVLSEEEARPAGAFAGLRDVLSRG